MLRIQQELVELIKHRIGRISTTSGTRTTSRTYRTSRSSGTCRAGITK